MKTFKGPIHCVLKGKRPCRHFIIHVFYGFSKSSRFIHSLRSEDWLQSSLLEMNRPHPRPFHSFHFGWLEDDGYSRGKTQKEEHETKISSKASKLFPAIHVFCVWWYPFFLLLSQNHFHTPRSPSSFSPPELIVTNVNPQCHCICLPSCVLRPRGTRFY